MCVIPDSVTHIGDIAFYTNELTSVSIGESTIIEDDTFEKKVVIIRRVGAGSSSKRQRMKLIGMQLKAALKF